MASEQDRSFECGDDAASKLIVALDYPGAATALAFVDSMVGRLRWVKVGLELYLAEGPEIIARLRGRGLRVFLDLKLHDIPNTVAGAVRVAARSGAELLTVHALGGPAMLTAAQGAAGGEGLRLLAVTALTSMDAKQLASVGLGEPPADVVSRLARIALESGVPGLVCSPLEVERLRGEIGSDPLLVVPGIRPLGAAAGDQSRTATPRDAMRAGASMLVVGRPITRAADPLSACDEILAEIGGWSEQQKWES